MFRRKVSKMFFVRSSLTSKLYWAASRKEVPSLLSEICTEKKCSMQEAIETSTFAEVNTKKERNGIVDTDQQVSTLVKLEYRLVSESEEVVIEE